MFRNLNLLLISSEPKVCSLFSSFLEAEGHHLILTAEPKDALMRFGADQLCDAVVFDLTRQPLDNINVLEKMMRHIGNEALWLLAPLGTSTWDRVLERLGVTQIIRGPLQRHDLEKITIALNRCATSGCAVSDNFQANQAKDPGYILEELQNDRYFLAGCTTMKKIYDTVRLLAPVDVPVLILGESGVGKDVVANLLHKHSMRAKEAYIGVNCAALPSELLESELFGYEAGAFTGAQKAKPGKFELADHGTLLLDEIGEMSASMQAKLLHVLQDGHFSRLGARATTQVDVRVIAATNVNIENAIADSSFREDLYYRISAFTVHIPPLRERRDEIPLMVKEMTRRLAAKFRKDPVFIPPSLMDLMQQYDWPGNLRELSNVLTRIEVLQSTEGTIVDLSTKVRKMKNLKVDCNVESDTGDMRTLVRNFKDQTESRLIQEALDAARWNRRHAAMELRISYRALLYKIQQYQLHDTASHLPPREQRRRPVMQTLQ
jgi:two-component system response regulator AtoC